MSGTVRHFFRSPRYRFQIVAGKKLPQEFHQMCAQTSPERAILTAAVKFGENPLTIEPGLSGLSESATFYPSWHHFLPPLRVLIDEFTPHMRSRRPIN